MKTRFVLIQTSHAGNVGAAARAMKTMGFDDLVLVAPRWANVLRREETIQRASGALDVLAQARIVETLDEALAARAVGDDLDTGLLGTLAHRARDELSSAPCPCVSTGQHGDDLVPRPDEGLQGRDSYGRDPGEEQTHAPSLRGATAGA